MKQEEHDAKSRNFRRDLESAKTKYISSLKKLRDELAANKKASWEQLELEWVHKKRTLDNEWAKR